MRRLTAVLRGAFARGAFPAELWFLLEVPGRRLLQPPERLADRLALAPDARVLEVGPGSGFFSAAVARRLRRGRLVLCDLQPAMLARARRKVDAPCIAADACRLPFAAGSFDVAFMVTVLGEVPDEGACLREVHRVLAPHGLLSVTEQRPDPDFIPLEALSRLAVANGFTVERHWGGRLGYTANLRRA